MLCRRVRGEVLSCGPQGPRFWIREGWQPEFGALNRVSCLFAEGGRGREMDPFRRWRVSNSQWGGKVGKMSFLPSCLGSDFPLLFFLSSLCLESLLIRLLSTGAAFSQQRGKPRLPQNLRLLVAQELVQRQTTTLLGRAWDCSRSEEGGTAARGVLMWGKLYVKRGGEPGVLGWRLFPCFTSPGVSFSLWKKP